jgi:transposase
MRREAHRPVFVDETGTNTKMTRLHGRYPKGRQLRTKARFGHWKIQTFIAGLRRRGLTAPFFVDQPVNRRIFDVWVETQLAPTLSKGDVIILDNLPAHNSQAAEDAIRAKGAWPLNLPPNSPDLNPIEMAFSKLKPICAPRTHAPSTNCAAPSQTFAISINQQNAQPSSRPQAMLALERPML